MRISIIAAVAKNRAIGKENRLLWRLPADMKFFKETTMGHPVITGRRNYESIPRAFRPLPGRTNIVLTRNSEYRAPGATVVTSLKDAIREAQTHNTDEIFVIGGGEVYRQALEQGVVNRMYLTLVDDEPAADTYFPDWDPASWREVRREYHPSDERNAQAFDIVVLDREDA